MAKCIVLILIGAVTAWKGKRWVFPSLSYVHMFHMLLRSSGEEAFFKKESPGRGAR